MTESAAGPMQDFVQLWVYLSTTPLFGLTVTLVTYVLAQAWYLRVGQAPWANPVLWTVLVLAVLLTLSGTPYPRYFSGAQFIHFLLGPATVALAVPLHANLSQVRRAALPILAALVAGSLTAVISALLIARAFGISGVMLASLAPKSVTAPVALGISDMLGGSPTLTAVLVILTGITGAVVATPLLNALRIRDWRARGFATGVAAHGIGTARAFHVNERAGAFAGIGMGVNAILTALIAPYVLKAVM